MNAFTDWSGIVLALITTIIAVIEVVQARRNRKTQEFKLVQNRLANNGDQIGEQCVKSLPENDESKHLLHRDKWMHKPGEEFIPLSKAVQMQRLTEAEEGECEEALRKNRWIYRWLNWDLPYPAKTLEENLSIIQGAQMFNGVIYSVKEIESDTDKLVIKYAYNHFFDFVNTSMLLGYEAAKASLKRNPQKHMGQRKRLLRKSANSEGIYDFENRVSTIGLVTLVVLRNVVIYPQKRNDETLCEYKIRRGQTIPKTVFVLHKRSENVTESKNMFNAIPAGIVQPPHHGVESEEEKDILHDTYLREFGEELLGKMEFTELVDQEILKEEMGGWESEHYFVGMGINPINLYLEVLAVSSIDMRGKEIEFKGNEESGVIVFKDVSKKNMMYYSYAHNVTPALKQIMKNLIESHEIEKKTLTTTARTKVETLLGVDLG